MNLSPTIQEYINNGFISSEKALQLDAQQQFKLEMDFIKDLILENRINSEDIEKIINTNLDIFTANRKTTIRLLMNKAGVTWEQLILLSEDQCDILSSSHGCRIVHLIVGGFITLQQSLQSSLINLASHLNNDRFYNFITSDIVKLDPRNCQRFLTENAYLKIMFLLETTGEQRIRELLANNIITLAELLDPNFPVQVLQFPTIVELMLLNILRTEHILQLRDIDALHYLHAVPNIINILTTGNITMEALIEQLTQAHNEEQAENNQFINDSQSTHRNSAHQSVSESATRLRKNYGHILDNSNKLEKIISDIKNIISSLPDDSVVNRAAKTCFTKITTNANYNFTDPTSNIFLKELLALAFLAISDESKRQSTFEEAIRIFISGLYEIQRGYNLNARGEDDGLEDKPICPAGAFNKLIEKLVGIHDDAEILLMTPAIAALKLPKIIEEESMRYLSELTINTLEEFTDFTNLLEMIKTDGLEIIYDKIKTKVINRMFEEFRSIYNTVENDRFIQLIDSGKDYSLDLDKLTTLQQQLQHSYKSLLFSPKKRKRDENTEIGNKRKKQKLSPNT